MRTLSIIIALFAFIHPAYAHVGHVGELAGHAHWVGLAAGVAVAAIAVALVKGKKNSEVENEVEEASSEDVTSDENGETA